MSYTEFPTDRIVDVRFKNKGPTPDCDPSFAFCNSYALGGRLEKVGQDIFSLVPTDESVAPFVGTFNTRARNGPEWFGAWGSVDSPVADSVPDQLAAEPYGLGASDIILDEGNMFFTNQQLQSLDDGSGQLGHVGWVVNMSVGEVLADSANIYSNCVPLMTDTYTFDCQMSSSSSSDFGIGISHLDPAIPFVTRPTEPNAVLTGGGSYTYHFQWAKWFRGDFHFSGSNEHDDSLGGPILVWWMATNPVDGLWTASLAFMGNTLQKPGDEYHWKLTAACIPEPNFLTAPLKRWAEWTSPFAR